MKLERGINLGGYLSQCVHSTEHYDAFIQEEDIRKIASMGFDHVRLAIDYEVLEAVSYTHLARISSRRRPEYKPSIINKYGGSPLTVSRSTATC